MIYQTQTLREWPYRLVRLACDLCPRRGQYRQDTLIARFGGDVKMPDLRHKLANCARRDAPGQAVRVYYADLREGGARCRRRGIDRGRCRLARTRR